MNTDTPETDELENNLGNAAHPVLSSFCRKLERERDEAREQSQRLRVENNHNWQANEMAEQAFCERDDAREQRDRLREALRRLAWVITLPDPMDAVRNIATEALQSLTPPNNP